jgi:hypothetical protein
LSADAGEESGLALGSDGKAVVGDEFDERVSNVGKGLGSGSGISAWHVGDAVVEDAFFDVDGVVVSGRAGCLSTPALIDSDVDENTSRAHTAKHGTGDEFGGFGSWNENGSDEEIDVREKFVEVGLIRKEGVGGMHGDIEKAHAFEVNLEDGDIGAEACGHAGGVDS